MKSVIRKNNDFDGEIRNSGGFLNCQLLKFSEYSILQFSELNVKNGSFLEENPPSEGLKQGNIFIH